MTEMRRELGLKLVTHDNNIKRDATIYKAVIREYMKN